MTQAKEHENIPTCRPTPERRKTVKEQKEEKKLRKVKLVVKKHQKDAVTKQWA